MNERIKYYLRFRKEIIFLREDENELYVKSVPAVYGGYFTKRPGGKEYAIAANSDTVTRAIEARKEVTKDEYENY